MGGKSSFSPPLIPFPHPSSPPPHFLTTHLPPSRCRPFNHGRDQSCAMISHLRHHAFLIENHFQTLTIDCSDTDQLIMTFPYIIAIFRASTQPLRLVLKLRNGLGEITPGGLNRGVRVGGYTGGRGRLVVGGGGCQTV